MSAREVIRSPTSHLHHCPESSLLSIVNSVSLFTHVIALVPHALHYFYAYPGSLVRCKTPFRRLASVGPSFFFLNAAFVMASLATRPVPVPRPALLLRELSLATSFRRGGGMPLISNTHSIRLVLSTFLTLLILLRSSSEVGRSPRPFAAAAACLSFLIRTRSGWSSRSS